jgi:hypothetical protein
MTDGYATRDFDLGVLARVSEGNRVVRYAPDLGLFATWHGPGVNLFHVWNDKGEEVDVFSTDVLSADAELITDEDAADAILRHFNYRRGMAEGASPEHRLEYLRGEIRAERISYGELAELQGLVAHIDPGDVELLEWAGVPEHTDDDA